MSWEQQYLAAMAAVIDRHGHAVQYVLTDAETGAPPFAYTVGLHTRSGRGYELALSGLPPEVAGELLNDLAVALSERQLTPADGLEVHGLLQGGLTLRLRKVARPEGLLIIPALYGTTPPVWQALWPDENGRFPGEPDCTLTEAAQAFL